MKTLTVFFRDLKTSFRQFIVIYIVLAPIILSLVIGAATSESSDTPIRIALLRGNNEQQEYLEKYAAVELFDNMSALRKRIIAHDDIIGIVPNQTSSASYGKDYEILIQGNEPEYLVTVVKTFKTYWEQGVTPDASLAKFHDFGRTNPPLKITLTTSLLLLVTVMSGMIIAINIVDEKADKTIRAMRVAPVHINSFVIGKCMIGVVNSIICGVLAVLLAGFSGINFLQVLIIVIAASFISFLFGFLAGLNSNDFISATAGLKLIMVPLAGSILAAALLSERWQWLFYWSPFYWAYEGINGVLAQTARWSDVLLHAGLTMAITLLTYFVIYPKIRKKLI